MAPRVGRGPTHLVHRGRLSLDPTSSGADAGLSDGSKRVQAPSTTESEKLLIQKVAGEVLLESVTG
jgi:hypothetical protein